MDIRITSHRSGSTVLALGDRPSMRIVVWGQEHKAVAQALAMFGPIVRLLADARNAVAEERDILVDCDTVKDADGQPRLDTMDEMTAKAIEPMNNLLDRIDAALAAKALAEARAPVAPQDPPEDSLRGRVLKELRASEGKPIPAKILYGRIWGDQPAERPECVVGSAIARLRRLGWPIVARTRGTGEEGYALQV